MEVADREQIGFPLREPRACSGTLALGAVSVAAAVIGDPPVPAVFAGLDMPARAAVRQFSIALITLSWNRLRCPVWAARYPGPAARKMSATSSEGRTRSTGRRSLRLREHAQAVERADHRLHRFGRHPGVKRRSLQLGVPQQDLDDADIDAVFEQVGSKAVAQRMRSNSW